MHLTYAPIWKEAPFIRLVAALIPGILLQWYCPLPLTIIYIAAGLCLAILAAFGFTNAYTAYQHNWLRAVCIMMLTALLGMWLIHHKNITHQSAWFGHHYTSKAVVIASIKEAPVEKARSFKVLADVYAIAADSKMVRTRGDIILYFQKDSSLLQRIRFGNTIFFNKALQPIQNAGNPGAFDYQRYCLFQGITHQVYLSADEFTVSGRQLQSRFAYWLHEAQQHTLSLLQQHIRGKDEAAVAEALLIGYRENLDREMMQQYADTGVIHVIAISGMHLAMIYGMLIMVLKPLQKNLLTRWLRGLLILAVLWSFTLLSGAGPSILRSAVMFSFIVAGESFTRRVSVYHTLAASAFFLLCSNPFFVWDAGFQLSYAAVLSIVIFNRPITNWWYCRYKIPYATWQMAAVTLSAQLLTTPLSLYHFHQLPNLFLFTNLLVVPLSGLILYGEILLCAVSGMPTVAQWLGFVLEHLLRYMNSFIIYMNSLPFSVTDNIRVTYLQTLLLYASIITIAVWLMKNKKQLLFSALGCLLTFTSIRGIDLVLQYRQSRLVVYNVASYSAIDLIQGGSCYFVGDTAVEQNDFLRNFHLAPARLLYRANRHTVYQPPPVIEWKGKRIIFLQPAIGSLLTAPVQADLVIVSGNPELNMEQLQQLVGDGQLVFDSSCPAWKIRKWKNECDGLHLRPHSVAEDGAFVFKL